MLPEGAFTACVSPQAANFSALMARKDLKRLYDIFGNARFAAASKLWQTVNAQARN
jgi:hypothetical protein